MATKRKTAAGSEDRPRGPSQVEVGATLLDVEALRQIIEALEASEVTRLSWRRGPERLVIVRGQQPVTYAAPLPAPSAAAVAHMEPQAVRGVTPASPAAAAPAGAPSAAAEKPGVVVTSPFVGTFYRTPAPDQPPFVEVGTQVRKGQIICIVEAMKLMNEIEAEVAGRVAEILVQNGQPVEFGQALFRIEPG